MYLQNVIETPKTIEEAVNRLLVVLTDQEKEEIQALFSNNLVYLHFTLGEDIRHSFGLKSGNTTLLGQRSEDEVSMEIIEELLALK